MVQQSGNKPVYNNWKLSVETMPN